jgi:methyl-accepting chemotaxis protein
MKFQDLKIGTRLGIGFAVVLLLATISSCVGLWRLNQVAASTRAMMQEPLMKERMTEEWYHITYAGLKRQLAIVKSSDPSLAEFFQEDAKASTARINVIQKYIEGHLIQDKEKELFTAVSAARKLYLTNRDLVVQAKKEGRNDDVAKLFEQFTPLSEAYKKSQQDFLNFQKETVNNLSDEVDAIAQHSQILVLSLIGAFVLMGGVFAWSLTRGITKPISYALDLARRVADGDLTSRIEVRSHDEMGQLLLALRDMTHNLVKIISQVRASTELITAESTQIASGNLDLSSRTEQQASTLEETASSMETLTSTVKQNAENAGQANHLAIAASQVAITGGTVMSDVVETMSSINNSSKRIADIIGVIDAIAFQTNILALNAAVEAARAGEQGRGFAVVATEVRGLAQRSASAAKEVRDLITDSVAKVDAGSKLVDQAGSTMQAIVESIKNVTDIMGAITNASKEQISGIEQVNQAIILMDDATQQNAALVEQAAAAAQTLQDQANSLAKEVNVFKITS